MDDECLIEKYDEVRNNLQIFGIISQSFVEFRILTSLIFIFIFLYKKIKSKSILTH